MVQIKEGAGASIKNKDFFEILLKNPPMKPMSKCSKELLLSYILETIRIPDLCPNSKRSAQNAINNFCFTCSKLWQKSCRNTFRFQNKNQEWLNKTIITSGVDNNGTCEFVSRKSGRPKKIFSELSSKTKRRRLEAEVQSKSQEELCLAASMKLHSEGNRSGASLILDISAQPDKVKVNKSENTQEKISYSCQEALSLFTELKLTRHQYITLRASAIRKQLRNLFPPYYKLIEEKNKCYPKNILVTETSAEVPLQDLVDHTASRVMHYQSEVLNNTDSHLEITFKWGADGSGSQSNFKQSFKTTGSDDSNLFISSLVPIQLKSVNNNNKIYWQNPRSNSVRYCRPIRMQFVKETDKVINDEFKYMQNQIEKLLPSQVEVNGQMFTVRHNLLKTMVDGKVCNTLSSNKSTHKCYICKASSSEFNNIEELQSRPYNPESLDLGLSSLHAYIRFYECLLHVSYKIPIQSRQARGEENKRIVNERKKHIQTEFRHQLGLLIDIPKPN